MPNMQPDACAWRLLVCIRGVILIVCDSLDVNFVCCYWTLSSGFGGSPFWMPASLTCLLCHLHVEQFAGMV
ncbi:hypothetical protein HDK64DRAFT_33763 [Phyllosticta capitalensis]